MEADCRLIEDIEGSSEIGCKLVRKVNHRLGRLGEVLIDLVGCAVLLVVLAYGMKLVQVFNAQRSPALGIPMSWVYAAVPVSAVLMGYYLIRDVTSGARGSLPPEV